MFGEPKDTENECNARLFIADNYGDGTATMRCQLVPGHDGPHKEEFSRDKDSDEANTVVITWTRDERQMCDHGCGHWDHEHHGSSSDFECLKVSYDHDTAACTYCCPGMPALTCAACGKTIYDEYMHGKYDCPKRPDAEEEERRKAEFLSAGQQSDEFAESAATTKEEF
jgi:hypothetical protein